MRAPLHPVCRRLIPALAGLLLAGCRPAGTLVRSGQVYVTSTPADATLHCDGVNRGQTPVTVMDAPAGQHLLRLSKPGFRDAIKTIALRPGERLAVDLRLNPRTAMLMIHSQPTGSDIELDDASVGKTPLLLRECALGPHRLTARLVGHIPRVINVSVADETPQKVEISLTSDSARLAIASTPPGAAATLDGALIGKTPLDLPAVASGAHVLELALAGHSPYHADFSVQAGETRQVKADLAPLPGTLKIVTTPAGARIYVNDTFRGESPLTLSVTPGPHVIRAESRGYDTQVRSNEVSIGAESVVELILDKSSGTILLTTQPAGVSVFLDGEPRGTTRARPSGPLSDQLELDFVPSGTRTLQLTCPGYFDVTRTVEIAPRQTQILHENLRPRPVPFVPTVIVRTGINPEDTFRGIIRDRYDNGDIRLEIEPGIFKTLTPSEVLSIEPIPGAR